MKMFIVIFSLISGLITTTYSQQNQRSPLPTERTDAGEEPDAPNPSHLFGEWFCDWRKTDIYLIKSDKTAQHFNDKGSWQVADGLLTIAWANGYRLTINLAQTATTITANSYPPGKEHPDQLVFTKVGHEPGPVAMPGTEVTLSPEEYLPVDRTLTDSSGRKIKAKILAKSESTVKFRRVNDGKEFEIPVAKLTADDQIFLKELGRPVAIDRTRLELAFPEESIQVSRLGHGPVGVLFFGTTCSGHVMEAILDNINIFNGRLLPAKTSFFLWEYPRAGVFKEVSRAISDYEDGDEKKLRPNFKGVATSILAQIREKTGLTEFLLVGNSLGAGIILWDYKELAADPKVSFLLISPTEAFMPPVSEIGKLERTMMLAAHGSQPDSDKVPDMYLKGREARKWVESNLDTRTLRRISTEPQTGPVIRGQKPADDPLKTDFSKGHKTIGNDLNIELLAEILGMKLGM